MAEYVVVSKGGVFGKYVCRDKFNSSRKKTDQILGDQTCFVTAHHGHAASLASVHQGAASSNAAAALAPATTTATASSTNSNSVSLQGEPWYSEVIELRKQANDYKVGPFLPARLPIYHGCRFRIYPPTYSTRFSKF